MPCLSTPQRHHNDAADENDNVQEVGKHARRPLKLMLVIDGGPTVIATTHPTKNANGDLLPRGGGAFLAEVDGNLGCQKVPDSMAVDLHWHGKFRGPDFSPIPFPVPRRDH